MEIIINDVKLSNNFSRMMYIVHEFVNFYIWASTKWESEINKL